MSVMPTVAELESKVLQQEWFYKFDLLSGASTSQYISDEVDHIHTTRKMMMLEALASEFSDNSSRPTAIDLSSHQGFFSLSLAPYCESVLGLELQQRHVDSANLIRDALGVENVTFRRENLETMPLDRYEPADIVLNVGLMYNVENPVGLLRLSRRLTKRVLLVETQTTILDLEGAVDSGHCSATNYMHGYFGVFNGNPNNIDGSSTDISLYPSKNGLIWILQKLGFRQVRVLPPPDGAYQQHATGKRIMIEARL